MTNSISDLKGAVIDGRAEAPRFKQRQLLDLHTALQAAHSQIVEAICADTKDTHAEAEAQYQLSVHAVKTHYSSLDLAALLDAEYSLANSKDHLTRRVPYGCAYILPDKQSLLYSVISPVAAAIAAGNCVAVELPQTLRQTETVLRQILTKALDQDSFAVVDSDPFDNDFKSAHVVTLNAVPAENAKSTSQDIKTPLARTAAIVDRSADITSAAKDIVRARFAFSGKSYYAPDIILVNEFCIKEFCSALAQNTLSYLTNDMNGTTSKSSSKSPESSHQLTKQIKDSEDATIVASGPRGTIALVHSRKNPLLTTKINEPILVVHSITSMDDAIDFLNTSSKGNTDPLLASYIFASPAATKYIGQFVSSDLTFANHIPVEILIGPPAPQGMSVGPQVHPRYPVELFGRPSPQIVSRSEQSLALTELVDGVSEVKSLASKLDLSVMAMNEPNANAVGFFEQGILLGLGLRLSGIVVASTVFVKYALPVLTSRISWK